MTEDNSERLVNALITKMEVMDNSIEILKQENQRLKSLLNNPQSLLKKMGMEDDPFRNDLNDDSILKGINSAIPQTNEDFHNMSWEDIHELANNSKEKEMIQ